MNKGSALKTNENKMLLTNKENIKTKNKNASLRHPLQDITNIIHCNQIDLNNVRNDVTLNLTPQYTHKNNLDVLYSVKKSNFHSTTKFIR